MNVENQPVQTCVLEPEWRVCVVTTAAKYWNHWGRFFFFFWQLYVLFARQRDEPGLPGGERDWMSFSVYSMVLVSA